MYVATRCKVLSGLHERAMAAALMFGHQTSRLVDTFNGRLLFANQQQLPMPQRPKQL
jgi:hypothetical protein